MIVIMITQAGRRLTGVRTDPGPCPGALGERGGGREALPGLCSLASPLPNVAPQMIQGETKWGKPSNSVARLLATFFAEIGIGTFRRSKSRNTFVESHGARSQGNAS